MNHKKRMTNRYAKLCTWDWNDAQKKQRISHLQDWFRHL